MNNRIKEIRTYLGLTLQDFGKRLGVTKAAVSNIENGNRNVTDQMAVSICREFNVNVDWLRSGKGEMFRQLPEEDQTAAYVSGLLEEPDNPLYDIIKEIMHTYNELEPKSQEALRDFSAKLRKNLESKKEG